MLCALRVGRRLASASQRCRLTAPASIDSDCCHLLCQNYSHPNN